MHKVSPLTYSVSVGEQITIKVTQSTGIAALVNYSLDGGPTPGTFPKGDPTGFSIQHTSLLGATCHFTDPSGGSCTFQIAGDPSEDPADDDAFDRSGSVAFQTRIYTFVTSDTVSAMRTRAKNIAKAKSKGENSSPSKK